MADMGHNCWELSFHVGILLTFLQAKRTSLLKSAATAIDVIAKCSSLRGLTMTVTVSTQPAMTAKLLDVIDVAALLKCSPRHVSRLADAGKMPRPVRLGGLVRWSAVAIDEWIAAGCPTCLQVKGAGA